MFYKGEPLSKDIGKSADLDDDSELLEQLKEVELATAQRITRTKKYDPRNNLNDLSGSEWVYFLNSLWITNYPRTGSGSHAFDLRKQHPSPKPPELLAEAIKFFTKKGDLVLDPFAGVGSTLLACSLTGRKGFGIELNQQFISIYEQICRRQPDLYNIMPLLSGDAKSVLDSEQIRVNAPYGLVIADPPYSDMLSRPRTKKGINEATPYSSSGADIGNIEPNINSTPPYREFLDALCQILEKSFKLLRVGGHLIVFCKDLQPTITHHNMLHADLVSRLSLIDDIQYEGMRIWGNMTPSLYPFGYPYAFVANQIHQYMLVFRREDESKVKKTNNR